MGPGETRETISGGSLLDLAFHKRMVARPCGGHAADWLFPDTQSAVATARDRQEEAGNPRLLQLANDSCT